MARRTVFLDVDNTLIDIEAVKTALRRHLTRRLGTDQATRPSRPSTRPPAS